MGKQQKAGQWKEDRWILVPRKVPTDNAITSLWETVSITMLLIPYALLS